MASPSPKRRKTIHSVGPSPAVSRASYLSPTKASIARFNPSLLPAQGSSPARKSQGRGSDALAYVLGKRDALETADDETTVEPEVRVEVEEHVPVDDTVDDTGAEADETRVSGYKDDEDLEATVEVLRKAAIQRNPRIDDSDDDLPETPQHKKERPEYQDTPPRGLLFSTPRKRKHTQTGKLASIEPDTTELTETSIQDTTVSEIRDTIVSDKLSISTQNKDQGPAGPTAEERAILKAKTAELNALRKQLRELQKEVKEYENHAKIVEDTPEEDHYPDIQALLALVNKSGSKARKEDEPKKPLSMLLTSFLPFSLPLPEPPSLEEDDIPVLSHAPLPDTKQLLSLFTPFDITSMISAPSTAEDTTAPVSQAHRIILTSPGGLLSCTLKLTIESDSSDPRHPKIADLRIDSLSPWVENEIGAWVRECEESFDIGAIGYGLGRYWEVSLRRARCWTQLYQRFPHLLEHGGQENKAMLNRSTENTTSTALSRSDLLRHLERRAVTLQTQHVCLLITWQLQHDWTGEVESKLSAKASFPEVWRDADTRNSLDKVPEMFDKLVKKMGVVNAVEGLVGVLFKESED